MLVCWWQSRKDDDARERISFKRGVETIIIKTLKREREKGVGWAMRGKRIDGLEICGDFKKTAPKCSPPSEM
jgi:hypothetical protein